MILCLSIFLCFFFRFIYSSIFHLFIYLFIYTSFIYSFIYISFIYSFIYYSFIYSFICIPFNIYSSIFNLFIYSSIFYLFVHLLFTQHLFSSWSPKLHSTLHILIFIKKIFYDRQLFESLPETANYKYLNLNIRNL